MFDWWEIIAIIFTATLCFMIVLTGIRKNKARLSYKKDDKTLILSTTESEYKDTDGEVKKYPAKMMAVVNSLGINRTKDFIILSRKTIEYSEKKETIIHSIIQDQMNSAELKLRMIETIVNKVFIELMMGEYGRNVNLTHEISFIIFHNGIRVALTEALKKLKVAFKENHFLDKTEHEFEDYCNEQAEGLYYSWQLSFDLQYVNSLVPSPEHLKSKMNKTVIINLIKDAFKTAREIANTKANILKKLEKDFDEDCKTLEETNIKI